MIFLVKKTSGFHTVTVFRVGCLCWGWMRRDGFSSEIQQLFRAGYRTHSHQYPHRETDILEVLVTRRVRTRERGKGVCLLSTVTY